MIPLAYNYNIIVFFVNQHSHNWGGPCWAPVGSVGLSPGNLPMQRLKRPSSSIVSVQANEASPEATAASRGVNGSFFVGNLSVVIMHFPYLSIFTYVDAYHSIIIDLIILMIYHAYYCPCKSSEWQLQSHTTF